MFASCLSPSVTQLFYSVGNLFICRCPETSISVFSFYSALFAVAYLASFPAQIFRSAQEAEKKWSEQTLSEVMLLRTPLNILVSVVSTEISLKCDELSQYYPWPSPLHPHVPKNKCKGFFKPVFFSAAHTQLWLPRRGGVNTRSLLEMCTFTSGRATS